MQSLNSRRKALEFSKPLSLFFLFLLPVFTACSSIRLELKGHYKSSVESAQGAVRYTNSYPIKSLDTWCWLTFWYAGGACWGYLTYPDGDQEVMILNDAIGELSKKLNDSNLVIKPVYIRKVGWESADSLLVIE